MKDQTKAPEVIQEPKINVGPLIEAIEGMGADEAARVLDESLHYLTQSFVTEGAPNGPGFANLLYHLRVLKNGILKAANIIDFHN